MQLLSHALTIREPFAHLIANGFKLAENRSVPFPSTRPMPYWVAIHAGLNDELGDSELIHSLADIHPAIHDSYAGGSKDEVGRMFGISEVIGAMRVVASFPGGPNSTDEQIESAVELLNQRSERCKHEGLDPCEFMQPEGHNWIINDVYRFHQPIVTTGLLGVWSMKSDLAELVNDQFARAKETGGLKSSECYGNPIIHKMPKVSKKEQLHFAWIDGPKRAALS